MSFVKKAEMTKKNLAAHRANGAQLQWAMMPEGQARVAAANLRRGFYAHARNGALNLRDVDPEKYLPMSH